MELWSVAALLVSGVGLLAAYVIGTPKWPDAFWRELAAKTRLAYQPDRLLRMPHLESRYQGYALMVDNHTAYTKSLRYYTRMRIMIANPTAVTLTIDDKLLATFEELIRPQDFITEDDEIDDKFVIQCDPPSFITKITTVPSLRQGLLQTQAASLHVAGQRLEYRQRELASDTDEMVQVLRLLVAMARTIDKEQAAPLPLS